MEREEDRALQELILRYKAAPVEEQEDWDIAPVRIPLTRLAQAR